MMVRKCGGGERYRIGVFGAGAKGRSKKAPVLVCMCLCVYC